MTALTYTTRDEARQAICDAINAADTSADKYDLDAIADDMVQQYADVRDGTTYGPVAYYLAPHEIEADDHEHLTRQLAEHAAVIEHEFWIAVAEAAR